MRRDATPAEACLWQALRNRKLNGLRFRRQHAINRYVADFYCAEARLVIEVDGPVHEDTAEQDAIRQENLETLGLTVLRFSNEEVLNNLSAVLDRISETVKAKRRRHGRGGPPNDYP